MNLKRMIATTHNVISHHVKIWNVRKIVIRASSLNISRCSAATVFNSLMMKLKKVTPKLTTISTVLSDYVKNIIWMVDCMLVAF